MILVHLQFDPQSASRMPHQQATTTTDQISTTATTTTTDHHHHRPPQTTSTDHRHRPRTTTDHHIPLPRVIIRFTTHYHPAVNIQVYHPLSSDRYHPRHHPLSPSLGNLRSFYHPMCYHPHCHPLSSKCYHPSYHPLSSDVAAPQPSNGSIDPTFASSHSQITREISDHTGDAIYIWVRVRCNFCRPQARW